MEPMPPAPRRLYIDILVAALGQVLASAACRQRIIASIISRHRFRILAIANVKGDYRPGIIEPGRLHENACPANATFLRNRDHSRRQWTPIPA